MTTLPTQLGPYTIEREIGRGGMGVVYLGHDTKLDRAVAIKALPEHLAGDAERLARFQREAKLLASLTHPNIAGVYGLEEHDGAQYLVMEFVEGETLAAIINRAAPSHRHRLPETDDQSHAPWHQHLATRKRRRPSLNFD